MLTHRAGRWGTAPAKEAPGGAIYGASRRRPLQGAILNGGERVELPKRKRQRLEGYNYSSPGYYFITICLEDMRLLLGRVVGGDLITPPRVELTAQGRIVEKYLLSSERVQTVRLDKYVIMPNHLHLILVIEEGQEPGRGHANQLIPQWVSALKRLCEKELGQDIFQRGYHDHIIRNDRQYRLIWNYIDGNPARWKEDKFYRAM